MEINYSGKSALIVDSKLEDLGALRQILSRIGVGHVQAASSVNMALSLMREITFDLCFAVYDIGKNEKNGLQLLREANAEQIFPTTSSFFLIVAPDGAELLFGSLESAPDAYISKPFDQAKIRTRLEKQLRIKEVIRPIELLLDREDYEEVYEQSRALAKHYPGLNVFLQRINGIALLKNRSYSRAKELFLNLTNQRELAWAEVGKGIAHFHIGEYEDTLACLNKVVDQQHLCVEAFTWLSRAHRMKGELGAATTIMRKAVMLQPTVPELHSELAGLAALTDDWGISKDSYQQAVRYARYSIFQTPEHYFGLARSLMQVNAKKLSEVEYDVIRVLEDVVLDHPEDQEVMFRAKMVNCDLYRNESDTARFEQMLHQTWNFFQRMDLDQQCIWLDSMVDMANSGDLAEDVLKVRKGLGRTMIEKEWGKANYTAMNCFRKGELDKAFRMFGRANELLPEHTGIALNLVQTGIEKAKRSDNALWVLLSVRDVLVNIHFGSLPEKQQQRYQTLFERFVEQYQLAKKKLESASPDPFNQEL